VFCSCSQWQIKENIAFVSGCVELCKTTCETHHDATALGEDALWKALILIIEYWVKNKN
jgi:hypothetical protein